MGKRKGVGHEGDTEREKGMKGRRGRENAWRTRRGLTGRLGALLGGKLVCRLLGGRTVHVGVGCGHALHLTPLLLSTGSHARPESTVAAIAARGARTSRKWLNK